MNVKEIVLKIRAATGLSQRMFADLTNLHRTQVSQFEVGTRNPLPNHALKYLAVSKQFKLKFKLEDFYRK